MKKILKIFTSVVFFVALLMVLSFSVGAYNESENNNSAGTANYVNLNETIYGKTSDNYDTDYYSFTLPNDGYIYITATCVKSDETVCVDILNSSETCILRQTKKMLKQSFTTVKIGLSAGRYYLVFNSGDIRSTPVGEYTLTIHYTASSLWEAEPNSKLSDAKSIELGTTYYGSFLDCYDKDSFCISVPENGYYDVTFSSIKSDDYADICFYNANGNELENFYFKCINLPYKTKPVYLKAGENYIVISINNADELCYDDYSICLKKAVTSESSTKPSSTVKESSTVEVNATSEHREVLTTTSKLDTQVVEDITERSEEIKIYNNMFKYIVVDSQVTIISYIGTDSDVIIPYSIREMPVVALANNVFMNTPARSVTVPDSVVSIGDNSLEYSNGESVQVVCNYNSVAANYANENGISVAYMDEIAQNKVTDNNLKTIIIIVSVISGIVILALVLVIVLIIKKKKTV